MSETQRAIRQIIAAIRKYSRFLLATHVRPDGDAIGSLLALQAMLRRLGKYADAYCRDPLSLGYEFLPGADAIKNMPPEGVSYDAAILVDCGDLPRVGEELAAVIRKVPMLINIDHHRTSAPFADIDWVETEVSSTAELLFDLCMNLSLAPGPDIATNLYVGILTDTGSFRYSNTSGRTMETAAILVQAGANPSRIAQLIYDSAPAERVRLLARVLSSIELFADGKVATAELRLNMFEDPSVPYLDSEGFINHLRSIKSVRLALLFREGLDGLVHVSMRSKEGTDVSKLAQKFGGGGHRQAAACRMRGKIDEIRSRLVSEAIAHVSE